MGFVSGARRLTTSRMRARASSTLIMPSKFICSAEVVASSAQAHRQAGSCPLPALDALNALSDRVPELVEFVRLHLHDHVVGARDRVDAGHARVRMTHGEDGLPDALRAGDLRLHEEVSPTG